MPQTIEEQTAEILRLLNTQVIPRLELKVEPALERVEKDVDALKLKVGYLGEQFVRLDTEREHHEQKISTLFKKSRRGGGSGLSVAQLWELCVLVLTAPKYIPFILGGLGVLSGFLMLLIKALQWVNEHFKIPI